jgi:NADH:ubiquinone reductase (H+-translocating)
MQDAKSDGPRVVIVGGGFAGLNCARRLGHKGGAQVMVIDKRNHHLFQPLLYQVAMAGLSPAEIAAPIRGLLGKYRNIKVLQALVERIDRASRRVITDRGEYEYDYLLLAAGAQHSYFGHNEWEAFAPGLKTLEQATEIRRRVLSAFERAEAETSAAAQEALLTFVVVGGGPTGVELAGAIGEVSRFTLARDYRNIDPTQTRVVLVEAGERILPSFSPELSARATLDLQKLGVQVLTKTRVTNIDADGVQLDAERLASKTTLWAAGVAASDLGQGLGVATDRQGRVMVNADLTLPEDERVFVAGDQAHAQGPSGQPLPGVATVALQQGSYVADAILDRAAGRVVSPFSYWDKGQMATIGRSRAILQSGGIRLTGFVAWVAWLLVHIYYLSSFRNRLLVLFQWAWSYMTFARGARLIVEKSWRSYK